MSIFEDEQKGSRRGKEKNQALVQYLRNDVLEKAIHNTVFTDINVA